MTNDSAKGYAYLAMIAVEINKKDVMNVLSEMDYYFDILTDKEAAMELERAERMGFGDE